MHRQSKEASILWSHNEETRELRGERDNARNNDRCTQARKATHGLDGQHQDVNRPWHIQFRTICVTSLLTSTAGFRARRRRGMKRKTKRQTTPVRMAPVDVRMMEALSSWRTVWLESSLSLCRQHHTDENIDREIELKLVEKS